LGTSTKSYEVIVRLRDGSTRAFTAANSASWRAGERVMIIEGTRQPSD
jgi:outer membrane lipoprotein SlyB